MTRSLFLAAAALCLVGIESRAEAETQPGEVGSRFVFRALGFAHNTAELDPPSYVVLKVAAERMLEVPDVRVRIEGHTDNTGAAGYNQSLSLRRANHVRDALVALGIEAKRIETVGRGSSVPIEANDTAEGRALNRRVEFVVIE